MLGGGHNDGSGSNSGGGDDDGSGSNSGGGDDDDSGSDDGGEDDGSESGIEIGTGSFGVIDLPVQPIDPGNSGTCAACELLRKDPSYAQPLPNGQYRSMPAHTCHR